MATSPSIKVLFLYTELAQYFISCVDHFLQKNNAQALIVRWPLNKEAPFEFLFSQRIEVRSRDELSDEGLQVLVNEFAPDIIVASGWVDRGYIKVCKAFKKQGIPTVMCSDTKWTGSWKQQVAKLISPVLAKKAYSDVWVTGKAQGRYAKELGFDEDHIHYGFYSADVNKFKENAKTLSGSKAEGFPKRFLYMGRYIESKGIVELVNAFIEIQNEEPNDWELWCCGTGELDPLPIEHEKVKHFGFIQVKDVASFIEKTGVFVLPSHFEPWGVVVHEMALSGMPMLLSSEIGAAEMFLEEEKNGFKFTSKDPSELKNGLKRFMAMNDSELIAKGKESSGLGLKHDPDKWSGVLESILEREKTQ